MIDENAPERLPGGNVAPVYRIGDSVRRTTGPWTPAVHALLRHLQDVGFAGAPRVIGIDDEGRESLTFIEGFVPYAPEIPEYIWTDDAMVAAAVLLRAYHDAVRTFEPPADARWRVLPDAPTSGEIICHNDVAPWNTVYRDGMPHALIDWDFAAPAPAIWDVAYSAARFVPLYYDGTPYDGARRPPDLGDYARRLRLFCDAYGLNDRGDLLSVVQARQRVMYETVRQWGEAGVPGFAEMWATGHADLPLRDLAFVKEHRRELASKL